MKKSKPPVIGLFPAIAQLFDAAGNTLDKYGAKEYAKAAEHQANAIRKTCDVTTDVVLAITKHLK